MEMETKSGWIPAICLVFKAPAAHCSRTMGPVSEDNAGFVGHVSDTHKSFQDNASQLTVSLSTTMRLQK
jgi:hypothetical protein